MSDQLLSVPLKVSSEIDITTPLRAVLKAKGFRPLEADWFKEFETLRNLAVDKGLAKNQSSVDTLARYHDQIAALNERGLGSIPNLSLYWESSLEKAGYFGGKHYYTYASSLELEKAAILYNMAALQTFMGVESRASNTDEGLKNAAKYYQNAAGIFLRLCDLNQEKLGITEGYTLTNDLHPDALTALASIMLAHAQEVIITKAIADTMKDNIVAKLCTQGEEYYKDSISKLKKDTVKNLWDAAWMNHLKGKQLAMAGLAEFHQSKVCSTQKMIGEQLARLSLAISNLKKAQDKLGTGGYVTKFIAEAEKQHAIATKDNNMIYLELIPSAEKLEAIERPRAKLVKPTPCEEKLMPNFKDIFEGMTFDPKANDPATLKQILGNTLTDIGKLIGNKLSPGK